MNVKQESGSPAPGCLVSRRIFLLGSGTALATASVLVRVPGLAGASDAVMAHYPRKKIGRLSRLKTDKPVLFSYPDNKSHSQSMLIKLGTKAGGGVGRGEDVVAFNTVCSHQGGPLQASYKAATKTLGACPFHLSTFDLTRYGIIVSGQAYQSLPQVLLEVDGDDIYAVGMMGLIFGRYDNLKA